ncbi:hypothetical protein NQZ68_024678 [Dissostichus eleginoides]|nr:hypothetical protein NQZ68_024678 [Dissostichus eleginoides]
MALYSMQMRQYSQTGSGLSGTEKHFALHSQPSYCAVWSCSPGPADSQLIMPQSERRTSLLPLAHLAAWWLLLICPQASYSGYRQ